MKAKFLEGEDLEIAEESQKELGTDDIRFDEG